MEKEYAHGTVTMNIEDYEKLKNASTLAETELEKKIKAFQEEKKGFEDSLVSVKLNVIRPLHLSLDLGLTSEYEYKFASKDDFVKYINEEYKAKYMIESAKIKDEFISNTSIFNFIKRKLSFNF